MAVPAAETPPGAASQPSTQKVTDVIKSFRPSRQFTHLSKNESTESRITSLDFDDQGEFLVGASDDETMHVFDIKEGKKTKTVPSKKYGIHLARFTHHSRQVLYASTKVDDSLRLLELHNEGYVRYFSAHTKQVTCIALSPGNDQFISCADDDTVCLWDLNSRNPQGKLKLVTPYLAAYDPSATVMAIASQATSSILLYDVRNYDKAPFATFDLAEAEGKYTPETRGRAWTKLEFSNDGKSMLLGTDYHGHFLLDAFEGNVKSFLIGRSGSTGRAAPVSSSGKPLGQGDSCLSQDGRYVLGGAGEQPDVLVWDTLEESDERGYLSPMTRLSSRGTKSVIVACNPRYNMFATADTKVTMWLPGESSKEGLIKVTTDGGNVHFELTEDHLRNKFGGALSCLDAKLVGQKTAVAVVEALYGAEFNFGVTADDLPKLFTFAPLSSLVEPGRLFKRLRLFMDEEPCFIGDGKDRQGLRKADWVDLDDDWEWGGEPRAAAGGLVSCANAGDVFSTCRDSPGSIFGSHLHCAKLWLRGVHTHVFLRTWEVYRRPKNLYWKLLEGKVVLDENGLRERLVRLDDQIPFIHANWRVPTEEDRVKAAAIHAQQKRWPHLNYLGHRASSTYYNVKNYDAVDELIGRLQSDPNYEFVDGDFGDIRRIMPKRRHNDRMSNEVLNGKRRCNHRISME